MKKPLKIILIILAVLVGLVAALLIWLTATQLNVKTETAVVTHGENSIASFAPGNSVSILTWNVGYAGLGEEFDFFMDGGKQVRAPSKTVVEKNMDGIVSTVKDLNADFTFLQEIDQQRTKAKHQKCTRDTRQVFGTWPVKPKCGQAEAANDDKHVREIKAEDARRPERIAGKCRLRKHKRHERTERRDEKGKPE